MGGDILFLCQALITAKYYADILSCYSNVDTDFKTTITFDSQNYVTKIMFSHSTVVYGFKVYDIMRFTALLSRLQYADYSYCGLTGIVLAPNAPPQAFSTSLKYFDLSHNSIVGPIPTQV